MKATMKYYHFFSQSRLYCRYRNLTGSAVKYGSRTVTAGRESHPAPKNFFYSVVYYMPLYVLFQGIFHINRRFNFFTNFIPEGYYNVYKVFPSQGVSHESLFSFCKHAPSPTIMMPLNPLSMKKPMFLHHNRHLQTYIDNLNFLNERKSPLSNWSLEKILYCWSGLPLISGFPLRITAAHLQPSVLF